MEQLQAIVFRFTVLKEFTTGCKHDLNQQRVRGPNDCFFIAINIASDAIISAQEQMLQRLTNSSPTLPGTAAIGASFSKYYTACSEMLKQFVDISEGRRQAIIDLQCLLDVMPFMGANRAIHMPREAWDALKKNWPSFLSVISALISKGHLSFPFKRLHFGNDPAVMFKYLQSYVPRIRNEPFELPNHRFATSLFPFLFDGAPVLFEAKEGDYEQGDKLVDFYQEEWRMRAKRADQALSPWQYWHDNRNTSTIFGTAMQDFNEISPRSLRESLYKLTKECTQFKPTLVVSIISFFKARRMLDFSAGWGDRLVGAIAANIDFYFAADPNADLRAGHDAIKAAFCSPDKRGNFQIAYEPFEKAQLPRGITFDLIFTSPPFFDFEIYTDRVGQSVISHPKLNSWLVCFLFFSLRKSWEVLDEGGHMVIHIADVYKTRVCEPMLLYCIGYLQGAHYRGLLASSGGAQRARPMWVLQKLARLELEAAAQAREAMKRHHQELYSLIEAQADRPMPSVGQKRQSLE